MYDAQMMKRTNTESDCTEVILSITIMIIPQCKQTREEVIREYRRRITGVMMKRKMRDDCWVIRRGSPWFVSQQHRCV